MRLEQAKPKSRLLPINCDTHIAHSTPFIGGMPLMGIHRLQHIAKSSGVLPSQ